MNKHLFQNDLFSIYISMTKKFIHHISQNMRKVQASFLSHLVTFTKLKIPGIYFLKWIFFFLLFRFLCGIWQFSSITSITVHRDYSWKFWGDHLRFWGLKLGLVPGRSTKSAFTSLLALQLKIFSFLYCYVFR